MKRLLHAIWYPTIRVEEVHYVDNVLQETKRYREPMTGDLLTLYHWFLFLCFTPSIAATLVYVVRWAVGIP